MPLLHPIPTSSESEKRAMGVPLPPQAYQMCAESCERCDWLECRLGGRNNYNFCLVRQQLGTESFKDSNKIQTWSAQLDTYNQDRIGIGSELSELESITKLSSTLPKRLEVTVTID